MGKIFCNITFDFGGTAGWLRHPADVAEQRAPPAVVAKRRPCVMAYGIAGYASWTSWVNMTGNHWPAGGESGSEFVA
jgi:hypothetical protein